MIHEVDETLDGIVKRDVLNGSNVEITFEAPSREWAARRSSPALNFYLYDITEDLSRRDLNVQETRNEQGRVVARRVPDKRFRLAYLVTAWTQRPQDEHRLLSSVLTCFLRFDALPAGDLKGSLADASTAIRVTVGQPLPKDRQLSDIWSALGGELKPSLDLVVTAPFASGKSMQVGKLVTAGTVLDMLGSQGQSETVTQAPEDGSEAADRPIRIRRIPE
ncbi:MAG TPA: DUF4255 domain-containing protein [Actinomycetota bacterium]|nr:DUF4255 domain-containing protein [Actinomycetota bacterium]